MSMSSRHEQLLQFYEHILQEDDVNIVIAELERLAPEILGCLSARVELGPGAASGIPLYSRDGSVVATVTLEGVPGKGIVKEPLFYKMAAWAIRRTSLLRMAQEQEDILDSLKVARKIVEEALPEENLKTLYWDISGLLKAAFYVGGDAFAYCLNQGMLCFLLIDAVGHGLGSTILASQCRAFWRALAYERDLGIAVTRLNQLLCEDTGPERFVAATLGYCHNDGLIEYVSCGQGPLFLKRGQEVELLSECEPPLGLFSDLDFKIQRLRLQAGDALVCVTDGILEWTNESQEMFSEIGVTAALSQPFETSEEILHSIARGLSSFCVPRVQRDDACSLAIRRLAPS